MEFECKLPLCSSIAARILPQRVMCRPLPSAGIALDAASLLQQAAEWNWNSSLGLDENVQSLSTALVSISSQFTDFTEEITEASVPLQKVLEGSGMVAWKFAAAAARRANRSDTYTQDSYVALIVFCTLLERIVRQVAQSRETSVVSSVLSDVIASKAFFAATASAGRWLVQVLQTVIGLPRGLNLRNLVLHGFLLPPGDGVPCQRYFIGFPLLIAAVAQTIASVVSRETPGLLDECCVPPWKSSLIPSRLHLSAELREESDGASCVGMLMMNSLQLPELLSSTASSFIPNRYYKLFQRNANDLQGYAKGGESGCAPEDVSPQKETKRAVHMSCGLLTLFPVIEHCLRIAFVAANTAATTTSASQCLLNGDPIDLALVAQDRTLFYTLDDILSPKLVSAKAMPNQRSVVVAAEHSADNQLRHKLGDRLHAAWFSILSCQSGWVLRDALAHSKVDLGEVPVHVVATVLRLVDETCCCFTSLACGSSSESLHSQIRFIRFLPQNLAACTLFDAASSCRTWGTQTCREAILGAMSWVAAADGQQGAEVEHPAPFSNSRVFECLSRKQYIASLEAAPWPSSSAPHEVVRQSAILLSKCSTDLRNYFFHRWESIKARKARTSQRRSFQTLVVALPHLIEGLHLCVEHLDAAYNVSHQCGSEALWIVREMFPFLLLAHQVIAEKHTAPTLVPKIAIVLSKHEKGLSAPNEQSPQR